MDAGLSIVPDFLGFSKYPIYIVIGSIMLSMP